MEVDAEGAFSCVSNLFMYLNVWQWAMGLVYHNSLPMFPSEGPFEPTYVESNVYLAKFTHGENILIMILKLIGIGFWSLTIAKLIHAITVLGNPAAINFQKDIDVCTRGTNPRASRGASPLTNPRASRGASPLTLAAGPRRWLSPPRRAEKEQRPPCR